MTDLQAEIRGKFGDDYVADRQTVTMGIDWRFTAHFAERFTGLSVLETCTGAGFTTIALARVAKHVTTVEIDRHRQTQAIRNVARARLSDRITFVHGDIMDETLRRRLPPCDAAFIDPDWATTGPQHRPRFIDSNTRPPADAILETILAMTAQVALVLPPSIDVAELNDLPAHERESLHMDGHHELICLYFGLLRRPAAETDYHV